MLVLQHPAEHKKRISSVPLLELCVNPVTVVRGDRFDTMLEPFARAVAEGYEPVLLFPSPSADCLDKAEESGSAAAGDAGNADRSKLLLVLVDGTWTQARHMLRHSPSLSAACRHVKFSQESASIFNAVRREPAKHYMSTAEAVARALPLLEPSGVNVPLATRHLEASVQRLVDLQLACVGSRPPRFMDRKRRTWNRKLRDGASSFSSLEAAAAELPPPIASTTALVANIPRDVREPLETIFSADEVATMAPRLAQLRASAGAVRRRVAQARFLLDGCEHAHERALIRSSLLLQPVYLTQQTFRAVFEDAHLLVAEKHFDTQIAHRTHQARRYREERTLVEWAVERGGGAAAGVSAADFRPCHQLDYATSGLLVLAKSREALRAATQAFDCSGGDGDGRSGGDGDGRRGGGSGYSVEKEYEAIVLGWPAWDEREWRGAIDVAPSSPFKMRVVGEVRPGSDGGGGAGAVEAVSEREHRDACAINTVDASVAARWGPSRLPPASAWNPDDRIARPRAAHMRVRVMERGHCALPGPLAGRRVSRLRLTPTTGRRHQLRVTLAHMGHPILGDVSYAGDLSSYRLMLHASALTFRGPPPPAPDAADEDVSHGDSTSAARDHATGRRAKARRRQQAAAWPHGRDNGESVLRALDGLRMVTDGDPFEGVLSPAGEIGGGRDDGGGDGGGGDRGTDDELHSADDLSTPPKPKPRARPPQMRLRRSLDASDTQRCWQSEHDGATRVVYRHDSVEWLRTGESAAGAIELPDVFDVITGLPDISEVRPRLSPSAYEDWLCEMAARILERLPPNRVAIFYLTPGRYSGEGGAWLDKGYCVQRGARQAGAGCVWQKVVLIQDAAGRTRGGRPGFVNLLCFSREHRVPRDFTTVDVLPDRGHMSWSHAIGEDACAVAIEYCVEHVSADGERAAVLNPFCGQGSVLAVANAYGLDAVGMDVSLKCCRIAAEHRAQTRGLCLCNKMRL